MAAAGIRLSTAVATWVFFLAEEAGGVELPLGVGLYAILVETSNGVVQGVQGPALAPRGTRS